MYGCFCETHLDTGADEEHCQKKEHPLKVLGGGAVLQAREGFSPLEGGLGGGAYLCLPHRLDDKETPNPSKVTANTYLSSTWPNTKSKTGKGGAASITSELCSEEEKTEKRAK